jgi:hypothetical protein
VSMGVRQFIVWITKRDGCALCGSTQRPLQMHHVLPPLKRFDIGDISHGAVYVPFDDFLLELRKTIPLCAKCHSSVHNGRWWVVDGEVAQAERFELLRLFATKTKEAARCLTSKQAT